MKKFVDKGDTTVQSSTVEQLWCKEVQLDLQHLCKCCRGS
ncbi:hypothetical protein A2U01_0037341, partial [Trifolium medium]|nr:hypothetical protein [Trifolium medium]